MSNFSERHLQSLKNDFVFSPTANHADFSTTANIYSHLDYGSKVQAANILTKAFGKDDKELLPKPTPPISEIEVVKSNVAEDMRNLGIESLAEYVSHLKQLVSEISGECTFAEVDKIKKTEMEM